MKHRVIFCLLIIFASILNVSAYQVVRQSPYYKTQNYYYNRILPNNLQALERYSMRHSYSGERPEKRLERLEKLAFGSPQAGSLESRYQSVETAILSRPQYNYTKKNLINNLSDYFGGQATGFTPPITYGNNPYFMPSINSPGFNNQRYEQYSNGIFGGGYNTLNTGYGNGSSIRILD